MKSSSAFYSSFSTFFSWFLAAIPLTLYSGFDYLTLGPLKSRFSIPLFSFLATDYKRNGGAVLLASFFFALLFPTMYEDYESGAMEWECSDGTIEWERELGLMRNSLPLPMQLGVMALLFSFSLKITSVMDRITYTAPFFETLFLATELLPSSVYSIRFLV